MHPTIFRFVFFKNKVEKTCQLLIPRQNYVLLCVSLSLKFKYEGLWLYCDKIGEIARNTFAWYYIVWHVRLYRILKREYKT